MKKLLTQQKMIEVIEMITPENLALLEAKMSPLDADNRPRQWFHQAIARGEYTFATVRLDGVDVACLWYWISRSNGSLVVNAAASLCDRNNVFPEVTLAAEKLARKNNCKQVEWTTARAGGVRQSLRHGFIVQGVVLVKFL